jgi:hypothetical protein
MRWRAGEMLLRPGFSACHDRFFSGAGPAVSVAIGLFRKSFIVIVSQMFHDAGIFTYIYPKNGPTM